MENFCEFGRTLYALTSTDWFRMLFCVKLLLANISDAFRITHTLILASVGCDVGQSSKENTTIILLVLLQSNSMLLLSHFKQSLRALAWQTLISQP